MLGELLELVQRAAHVLGELVDAGHGGLHEQEDHAARDDQGTDDHDQRGQRARHTVAAQPAGRWFEERGEEHRDDHRDDDHAKLPQHPQRGRDRDRQHEQPPGRACGAREGIADLPIALRGFGRRGRRMLGHAVLIRGR